MANKLISQLTAGAANLQDIDQVELQVDHELFTRRITGLQLRAVEKTEREAQDNVIEASVGLNANGTFTAPANSWNLRSVDFTAGCTDRGGATGALTENVLNALRLLDAKMTAVSNGNISVLQAALNSDTTLTDIIPAGYLLQYVIFEEKTGNDPILDLGLTAGGNEVFINQALNSSALTTITIGNCYSLTGATTLYLNATDPGSTWDGSTVDVYFVMLSALPGGSIPSGIVVVGYYKGAYNLTPTQGEIIAIIGDASTYDAGSLFIINDTALTQIFFYMSDGTNWAVNTGNFSII
jgi:hypothetical protein